MTKERSFSTLSGWPVLFVLVVVLIADAYGIYLPIRKLATGGFDAGWITFLVGTSLGALVLLVLACGFFTLQPNMSAVLLLFGKYKGTAKDEGFRWANPFYTKKKVSLRAHNLNGEKLKVNDRSGNPIEIALVVVWRVADTAEAVFDVEDYVAYVSIQSESALRHLATKYPYDTGEQDDELSLRGSIDEVSHDLQEELAERLGKAGVTVDEARLSHLAYAQEIAGAMLQRQQAEAIVAARRRIVDGAVGMVEMALAKLEEHNTVKLDDERKATMVSNLLVVLCGEKAAHPIVNAGSLY
jgi:regulator of protease activity HflC (stomatin/prohibitin superfamily)